MQKNQTSASDEFHLRAVRTNQDVLASTGGDVSGGRAAAAKSLKPPQRRNVLPSCDTRPLFSPGSDAQHGSELREADGPSPPQQARLGGGQEPGQAGGEIPGEACQTADTLLLTD